jgi:hypothetical protein
VELSEKKLKRAEHAEEERRIKVLDLVRLSQRVLAGKLRHDSQSLMSM